MTVVDSKCLAFATRVLHFDQEYGILYVDGKCISSYQLYLNRSIQQPVAQLTHFNLAYAHPLSVHSLRRIPRK